VPERQLEDEGVGATTAADGGEDGPATIIDRPVKNAGQSRAPRHSISPFQHGGPSSGNSISRTRE